MSSGNVETRKRSAGAIAWTVFVAVVLFGTPLWFVYKDLDVLRHEAWTTATVTGEATRGVISYQYEINGQSYRGGGYPGSKYAPFTPGSTFPIRYSTAHPSFSTAQHPLTFPGQLCFALVLVGGLLFLNRRGARKRP